MIFLLLFVPIIALALYAVGVYNFLATAKVRIKASIQEIGNQLKRQAELIPNLEESVKGYLKHEKEIFALLTTARKSVASAIDSNNLNQMVKASDSLAKILPSIQATLESNPELKASELVTNLMSNLTDTADKVSYSRRLLIDLTADYNTKLVTFPDSLLANSFGFKAEAGLITLESGSHLEVTAQETVAPKVKL